MSTKNKVSSVIRCSHGGSHVNVADLSFVGSVMKNKEGKNFYMIITKSGYALDLSDPDNDVERIKKYCKAVISAWKTLLINL